MLSLRTGGKRILYYLSDHGLSVDSIKMIFGKPLIRMLEEGRAPRTAYVGKKENSINSVIFWIKHPYRSKWLVILQ